MSLLHRNKLFPWKWNETPLNETPFRNKHFPLPLPGTHHLFPSLRRKPPWRHIGKREDPGDKPWNQRTPPCTPSFTTISRQNLHDNQFLWHFWLKSWPNLKLWWQYLHLRSLSLFGFVLESDLKHFVFSSPRRTSDIAGGCNCKNQQSKF